MVAADGRCGWALRMVSVDGPSGVTSGSDGAEDAAGKAEECGDQVEYAVYGDADQAEGQQDEPDEGVEDESDQGERPAEEQEEAEEQESEHGMALLSSARVGCCKNIRRRGGWGSAGE